MIKYFVAYTIKYFIRQDTVDTLIDKMLTTSTSMN